MEKVLIDVITTRIISFFILIVHELESEETIPDREKCRGSGMVSQFRSADRTGVGGQQGGTAGVGSSPAMLGGAMDVRPRTRIVLVSPVRVEEGIRSRGGPSGSMSGHTLWLGHD
ncbi:hypothetical protein Droror1_Dr00023909 [Drosera rotundifolia]